MCLYLYSRHGRRHLETDGCRFQPAVWSARKAGVRRPGLLSGQPCWEWVWCSSVSYEHTLSIRHKHRNIACNSKNECIHFLLQTSGSGMARWKSKWQLGAEQLWQTRSAAAAAAEAAALCSQGNYKLLLTQSVLIHSDIHWSQPGEKRMTGGTNWQPKAAPTTTWNPVSMVTQAHFSLVLTMTVASMAYFTAKWSAQLCAARSRFVVCFWGVSYPYMRCPVSVSSATVNHGLPCHHTNRHDGIWHGQYNTAHQVARSNSTIF